MLKKGDWFLHVPNAAAAGLALVGGSLALLAGGDPEVVLGASAVGTIVGGSVPILLKELLGANKESYTSLTRLINLKYTSDLRLSIAHSDSRVGDARDSSYKRVQEMAKKRKGLPRNRRNPVRLEPGDFQDERFVQVDRIQGLTIDGLRNYSELYDENWR